VLCFTANNSFCVEIVIEYTGNKTYINCSLCNSETYLCSNEGKRTSLTRLCFNCIEGSEWELKKAKIFNMSIPSERIVSRVQVELTAVKMCIYEEESPTVSFEFAETGSNDPHPQTAFLSDTCGCNICPETQELEWSVAERQWSGFKQFALDVDFQGGNSTLCIHKLTIKLQFAGEISFVHLYLMFV
jgi:hypothetical protein